MGLLRSVGLDSLENMASGIPILGPVLGAQSDAELALVRKQKQMAAEAARREQQSRLTAPNMTATAQSLLAFNPLNQRMAQTYGPQAAFSPEQFANMVKNPNAMPGIDEWARQQGPNNAQKGAAAEAMLPGGGGRSAAEAALSGGGAGSLVDYRGTDPEKRRLIDEYIRQKQQFDQAEERRRQMMLSGISRPGPGPAPIQTRAPQATRRF